jgi:hypothetical protein
MYDLGQLFKFQRTKLIPLLAILILFLVLYLASSRGVLQINNTTGENVKILLGEEGGREFNLEPGQSKRIFQKRENQKISVNGLEGDKITEYRRDIAPLWSPTKINVRLAAQSYSQYTGQSAQRCSDTPGADGSVRFYSCKPSTLGVIEPGAAQKSEEHDHDHDQDSYSSVLKRYKDGFLKITVEDKTLSVTQLHADGSVLNSGAVIKNFESTVADEHVSVLEKSAEFMIFDQAAGRILSFSNINQYKTIAIDKKYIAAELETNEVFVTKNYVYMTRKSVSLDDHGKDFKDNESADRGVLIISRKENKVVKFRSQPYKWVISSVSASSDDKLVINVTNQASKNGVSSYIIEGDGRIKPFGELPHGLEQLCWDGPALYYTTGASSFIYRYSFSERASYLVYGGLADDRLIENLSCGSVKSFTLSDKNDNASTGHQHYRIADKTGFSGTRIESLLPAYVDLGEKRDSVEIIQDQSGFYVRVLYDSPRNGLGIDRNMALSVVNKYLTDRGVDVENIKLQTSF